MNSDDGENTPAATAKEKKKEPKEESEDDMGFCLTIWDFFSLIFVLVLAKFFIFYSLKGPLKFSLKKFY